MRNYPLLFLIFYSFNLTSQPIYTEVGDTLFVFSINGLNIRDSTSVYSNIISKAEYAEKIVVTEVTYAYNVIDKRRGIWLKIKNNKNLQGFVFSGYLTKLYPPSLENEKIDCDGFIDLIPWIEKNLEKQTVSHVGRREFKGYDLDKGGESISWNFYSDGTMIYKYTGYEFANVVIETLNIDFNDILNFLDYYIEISKSKCKDYISYQVPKLEINDQNAGIVEGITCYNLKLGVYKVGLRMAIEYSTY